MIEYIIKKNGKTTNEFNSFYDMKEFVEKDIPINKINPLDVLIIDIATKRNRTYRDVISRPIDSWYVLRLVSASRVGSPSYD